MTNVKEVFNDIFGEQPPHDTLYSLVTQANSISRMLTESGGEIGPELDALMAHVDVALPEKIDGYQVVMERLDVEADYWKTKADQYAAIARSHKTVRDRLQSTIKLAMVSMGVDEIKGVEVRFKLSNVKPALVIDFANLNPAYLIEVKTLEPDKDRIRAALTEGATIAGAELVQNKALRSYANKGAK